MLTIICCIFTGLLFFLMAVVVAVDDHKLDTFFFMVLPHLAVAALAFFMAANIFAKEAFDTMCEQAPGTAVCAETYGYCIESEG